MMDTYEKKYKDALGWMREVYPNLEGAVREDAEHYFPELAESEDERIRMWLLRLINTAGYRELESDPIPGRGKVIAWLEKQKENPKNDDSISADCVSDAKCEDRWHKTANSLPDSGRDVLAKDALGNYLLASFDSAQWFVSVYDGQDHPILHTPPILEWCDIPSEKQKESLHIPETCKENADSLTDEDERIRKWMVQFISEIKSISEAGRSAWAVRKEDAEMCATFLAYLERQKEQKPDVNACKARARFIHNILSGNDMKKMVELYNDEIPEGKNVVWAVIYPDKPKEQKLVEWSEETKES